MHFEQAMAIVHARRLVAASSSCS